MTTLSASINEIVSELDIRIRSEVRDQCKELVPKYVSHHKITLTNGSVQFTEIKGAHTAFSQVMKKLESGLSNILLIGPTGAGKTHLCQDIAKALDLPFGLLSLSEGVSESHLFGRVLPKSNGAWEWSPTSFINIFENGGVFLFDEFDCASPNLLLAVNSALAQGEFHNIICDKRHVRHQKTIILCCANTFGHGADTLYIGRNQLDAATLDRFVLSRIYIDYDTTLEEAISAKIQDTNNRILFRKMVTDIRRIIKEKKLRRVISTRFVINGTLALNVGITIEEILKEFLQDWSKQEREHIIAEHGLENTLDKRIVLQTTAESVKPEPWEVKEPIIPKVGYQL